MYIHVIIINSNKYNYTVYIHVIIINSIKYNYTVYIHVHVIIINSIIIAVISNGPVSLVGKCCWNNWYISVDLYNLISLVPNDLITCSYATPLCVGGVLKSSLHTRVHLHVHRRAAKWTGSSNSYLQWAANLLPLLYLVTTL